MTKKYTEIIVCKLNGQVKIEVYVSEERWEAKWKRKNYWVDFGLFTLPQNIIEAGKSYLRARLRSAGPSVIEALRFFLKKLSGHWSTGWDDLNSLKLVDWMMLWESEQINDKKGFRLGLKKFYRYCSDNGLAGADEFVSSEIITWSTDDHEGYYRDVLTWHEERGAMTSGEQELVRRNIMSKGGSETINENYTRLFLWVCFETLKRPSQILEITNDALLCFTSGQETYEYFLRIPKAKWQAGRAPELWPITNALAFEIIEFSKVDKVKRLQGEFNRLLVHDSVANGKPNYSMGQYITRWVRIKKIISPRTKRLMIVTPYRIRHTGATSLALQGISSIEIQYILEHDTPYACQAYIDAIGSELCPLLERADRKLGLIFTQLNDMFFKGAVKSDLSDKLILIPLVEQPAVVGSCGLNGRCNKHPFFKCYDGCKYFIAWKDADHTRALQFVEAELARWTRAEGVQERSKAIKDFERLHTAITEVIQVIESGG
jgi:hypothetical protein